jgi:hypothetical protein
MCLWCFGGILHLHLEGWRWRQFFSEASVNLQWLHGIIPQNIELFKYQLIPHATLTSCVCNMDEMCFLSGRLLKYYLDEFQTSVLIFHTFFNKIIRLKCNKLSDCETYMPDMLVPTTRRATHSKGTWQPSTYACYKIMFWYFLTFSG